MRRKKRKHLESEIGKSVRGFNQTKSKECQRAPKHGAKAMALRFIDYTFNSIQFL